jgi:hypothetical protein
MKPHEQKNILTKQGRKERGKRKGDKKTKPKKGENGGGGATKGDKQTHHFKFSKVRTV